MKLRILIAIIFAVYGCSDRLDIRLKVLDKRPYLVLSAEHGIRVRDNFREFTVDELRIEPGMVPISGIAVFPSRSEEAVRILSDIPEKKYSGSFQITREGTQFRVINRVSEEHYLSSVVGSEMDDRFPEEARKAQAVVSRTILRYLVRKGHKISDLSSEFQAYRGAPYKSSGSALAVKNTKGIFLTYRGRPFYTYFHSTCGGTLLPPDPRRGVAAGDYPGIPAPVADRFRESVNCSASPYFHWERILTEEEIQEAFGLERVNSLKAVPTDEGWNGNMEIYGDRDLKMATVRFLSDIWKTAPGLKSYFFKTEKFGSAFRFSGTGFGHHTGMCQWGARGLAEQGWNYRDILLFYYPGTDLEGGFPAP